MMMRPLSGERFSVDYRLSGDEDRALRAAEAILYEQTVELPKELLSQSIAQSGIVGRLESFLPHPSGVGYRAQISYAVETVGEELPQFLNVLFGNSSIKPGIRVEDFMLPPGMMLPLRGGPRFGRDGLRQRLKVQLGPMLCTPLKPMGHTSEQLAALAYQFALGGIDIIKDDHGLANQPFAPFKERVRLCSAAIRKANALTGGHSIYVPNVTAPAGVLLDRARFAQEQGAAGLLVAPGLCGFDTMRSLSDSQEVSLPLFSHPALLGSFVCGDQSGIAHKPLFGLLMRLAGADAVIYPNFGGRFSFTKQECADIVLGTQAPMGHIQTAFPVPGGGMTLQNVAEMREFYGPDVIFLIGGGLFGMGPDIVQNCKIFRKLLALDCL